MKRILLSIGVVIALGGCSGDSAGVANETDCRDGCWHEYAPAPQPRQELQPAVLDGKVYLVGGLNGTSWADVIVESSVDVYDVAMDSWVSTTPLPVARHHVAVAASEGKLYASGGMSGRHFNAWVEHAELFEYDPATATWTERAPMPAPRAEHLAFAFEGKTYFIGGRDENGDDTGANEMYDPAADTWFSRTPMPTLRRSFAAAVLDSLIYVVGGRFESIGSLTTTRIVEAYSPRSDRWYRLANLPLARAALALGASKGRLYAMGGESLSNGGRVFRSNWEYDPEVDSWRGVERMRIPVHGIGAVTAGDRLLVLAGATRAAVYSSTVAQGFQIDS